MNNEQSGLLEPEITLSEQNPELPLPNQVRAIEKDMYNIMTTQVKLAIMQLVIAVVSLLAALIIAMCSRN